MLLIQTYLYDSNGSTTSQISVKKVSSISSDKELAYRISELLVRISGYSCDHWCIWVAGSSSTTVTTGAGASTTSRLCWDKILRGQCSQTQSLAPTLQVWLHGQGGALLSATSIQLRLRQPPSPSVSAPPQPCLRLSHHLTRVHRRLFLYLRVSQYW